jgi:hypothetical protein
MNSEQSSPQLPAKRTSQGHYGIDEFDPIRKSGRIACSAFSEGNRTT